MPERINLVSLDGTLATFTYQLKACKQCGKSMLERWVSGPLEWVLQKQGLEQEDYTVEMMCRKCVLSGTYIDECHICSAKKSMPADFAYQVTFSAKHPDDETNHYNICKACITSRSLDVIDLMGRSDDIKVFV